MNAKIEASRWCVGQNDFAVRVILPDLKGFFDSLPIVGTFPKARTLIIEPGTMALVIDDGLLVGQFGAGSYTLETFLDRLQVWRNKQATVFLTRCEDLPLECQSRGIPCADDVCFDIKYRWTVQIADVIPFMQNLMGARDQLSVPELDQLIAPLVAQAVYVTIGRSSYDHVRRPDFASQLLQGVKSELDVKLKRYGLAFVDVQNVALHSEVDQLADKKGELFRRSRELQLTRAANELGSDELTVRLSDYRKKTDVRDQLRRVVSDDKVNALASQNDFEKVLFDIDKDRLLRTEERESLLDAFKVWKEDRNSQRTHLLATLDLQRERELEELRLEMDHVMQQKALVQEIELAKLSRSEETEKWRHELQQEQEHLTHRLTQKQAAMKGKWERIREARQQSRSDSWEAMLHDRKMEDVRGNLEVAKAERARKVALIQAELDSRLAAEKLEVQRRQQDWELENRDKRSESQLHRLQRIQEMNAQFAEKQMRMHVEMENLKADTASKRELERIQAMSNVSSDVLIATANTANAALLADLKKHDVGNADRAKHDEERLRLYEKMNETERAKADAIAEAYKTAMQAQQSSVQQVIGGLTQASSAPHYAPTTAPPFGPGVAPPPMPSSVHWHASINGQQSPPMAWPQLQQCIQVGQVNASTLVWRTGMLSWLPAGQVPELAPYVGTSSVPPPMPSGSGLPSPPPT